MPSPRYLYTILDRPPADPLPETLPSTDLDSKHGFIHLSTAEQTPVTANLFFAHLHKIWMLTLKTESLEGELKYSTDPNGGVVDGCAHLHGVKLGLRRGDVEEVIEVAKEGAMEWTEVPVLLELIHLET